MAATLTRPRAEKGVWGMRNEHGNKPDHSDRDSEHPDGKGFSIVVNGRKKTVEDEELTFDRVVALAFADPPTGEFICITITYRHAGGRDAEGTLIEGESVKVRDGTIFNVTITDKS